MCAIIKMRHTHVVANNRRCCIVKAILTSPFRVRSPF
nr:MAG TPA: hypothetical protein [Caudoviricetes sp.]